MLSKATKKIFKMLILLLIFATTVGVGFTMGFKYVISQNDRFSSFQTETEKIGVGTKDAVMVVLKQGADTADIADNLEEKGVIGNKFAFMLMSKINGFDGRYKAGTHFVKATMSYDEIMYLLCMEPETVSVTFQEGLSYRQVKEKLIEKGVLFDEAVLDELVSNPAEFLDYDFVTQIPQVEGRDWFLQGYLFPDTYQFDMNTTEESIVRTFLSNMDFQLIDELYARAEVMGFTMDQVITLASVVEKECGRADEMDLIAGVFINRLKAQKHDTGNRLESDATINYIKAEMGKITSLLVTNDDKATNSGYNTYMYSGLPVGPICSPGLDAIRAVLWPAKHNYYYFVSKNDDTGSSAFATTQNEHFNNVNKYMNNTASSTAG
jgi:UPF0755 protein